MRPCSRLRFGRNDCFQVFPPCTKHNSKATIMTTEHSIGKCVCVLPSRKFWGCCRVAGNAASTADGEKKPQRVGLSFSMLGGSGEIRTHERFHPSAVFKFAARCPYSALPSYGKPLKALLVYGLMSLHTCCKLPYLYLSCLQLANKLLPRTLDDGQCPRNLTNHTDCETLLSQIRAKPGHHSGASWLD